MNLASYQIGVFYLEFLFLNFMKPSYLISKISKGFETLHPLYLSPCIYMPTTPPILQLTYIEFGLKKGYQCVHIGVIQFNTNPLVGTSVNIYSTSCITDSRPLRLWDSLIVGFENPLHNGLVWKFISPKKFLNVTEPHINS